MNSVFNLGFRDHAKYSVIHLKSKFLFSPADREIESICTFLGTGTFPVPTGKMSTFGPRVFHPRCA